MNSLPEIIAANEAAAKATDAMNIAIAASMKPKLPEQPRSNAVLAQALKRIQELLIENGYLIQRLETSESKLFMAQTENENLRRKLKCTQDILAAVARSAAD